MDNLEKNGQDANQDSQDAIQNSQDMQNLEQEAPDAEHEALGAELDALARPLWERIGGQLTTETMPRLSADEITLLAYQILRNELMEGGFVQLIQNGYGPFIFLNPFARALREWGDQLNQTEGSVDDISLKDFSKWLYKARKLYDRTRTLLETPTEDEDAFMALYEQVEDWDEFDDAFIDFEPAVTTLVIRGYKHCLT